MFTKEVIQNLTVKAQNEKWSYPKIFDELKSLGVKNYRVDVATHEIIYEGIGNSVVEEPKESKKTLKIGAVFNITQVQQAIRNNQQKKTNYAQFLEEIAAAGVSHYEVNMEKRTVNYQGKNNEEYIEKVPTL